MLYAEHDDGTPCSLQKTDANKNFWIGAIDSRYRSLNLGKPFQMPPEEEETFHDGSIRSSTSTSTSSEEQPNMNPKKLFVTGGQTAIATALSKFHPVVIEGMGHYDPRDPTMVAQNIHADLQAHWKDKVPQQQITKPKLVIVQGDPLRERGISAITPQVATLLGVPRGLVCLDEEIADYHAADADRDNVTMEFRYSDLVQLLEEERPGVIQSLEEQIDILLEEKNSKRRALDKPPLKSYFRDFAMLQEVTKAACRQVCGELTVAHTQSHISEFSVTSFYKVGLELGLVDERSDMVYYGREENFDFDQIDRR